MKERTSCPPANVNRLTEREAEIVSAVVASLDPSDKKLGLKREYLSKHQAGCDPTTGFCSVAVEAVWAMLGGNPAGYERTQVRMPDGGTHWFLRTSDGRVIDPTVAQFGKMPVPYCEGRGRGIPVTLKYGVLHRGRRDLLISNKASHLIEMANRRLRGVSPSGLAVSSNVAVAAVLGVALGAVGVYAARQA